MAGPDIPKPPANSRPQSSSAVVPSITRGARSKAGKRPDMASVAAIVLLAVGLVVTVIIARGLHRMGSASPVGSRTDRGLRF
jgi:hypothetical protein